MAAIAIPLHQPGRARIPGAARLRPVVSPAPVRGPVAVPVAEAAVRRAPVSAATYRRRQLVAFAVTLLLMIAAVVAVQAAIGGLGTEPLTGPEPAGGSTSFEPIARSVYVVQPGDTLWEIARALQPEGDVRPLVGKIADQRGGAPLQVGERISLP